MNSIETTMQKRQTDQFIKADSILVSLKRPVKVPNGAGGVKPGSVEIVPPQTFRLVPANSSVFQSIRNKLEGNIPQEKYMLIGYVDADVKINDEFTWADGQYYISYISTERSYQTTAGVVYRGPVA